MPVELSSDQVWTALDKELFAVLGMVTAKGEARTVGIVYTARDRKIYIGTGKDTWKARHVAANPKVSLTVTIPKRIPIMPWIKIPAATITCSGTARVIPGPEADPAVLRAIFRGLADDAKQVAEMVVIEVVPQGEFLTYGVGIPLMQMRFPEKARGRAPVR